MTLPSIYPGDVVAYLRVLADWIESEGVDVPEASVKTWPLTGSVLIGLTFKAQP